MEPNTLKVCAACGGHMIRDCDWCNNGFMDQTQQLNWNNFRQKIRNESGTYEFLQEMTRSIIERLTILNTSESKQLSTTGESLLIEWLETEDRSHVNKKITDFNKKALNYITKIVL